MIRVNLIARDNGFGLSRDLRLLQGALAAARCSVTVSGIGRGALRKALHPLKLRVGNVAHRLRGGTAQRWDINLMLERVRPEYLATARRNVLRPNPEWFDPRDRACLPHIDRVFAFTHHAVPIFEALGLPVDYTGFTSEDRMDRSVPRERTFFHLAGRSRNKGTATLLHAWRAHPEWPRLTVLQSPRSARPGPPAANIVHRLDYIADAELQHLQNANLFHLCPSETEGFGHYLVEAMGVGAVVATLDAPPMNEMVARDRGALMPYASTGRQGLATTYFYETAALEATVENLLATSDAELRRTGDAARAWFEANDRAFRARLAVAVRALVA